MPPTSTSDAVAKLLARQPQQPWNIAPTNNQNQLLVVNPDGDALHELAADAWCFHAGHAKYWRRAFCQALPPDLRPYQGVLLIAAKEQALNQYILQALASLAAGTPIWLVGEKRGGISSLVKRLPDAYAPAQKLASANHCQLFVSHVQSSATLPLTQLAAFLTPLTVSLDDVQLQLQTLPGVFSQARLDQGTELLLANLPSALPEPIVDFACGNGVIARVLHERQQPQLIASDVNPMATAAAAINLAHSNAEVILSEGLPSSAQGVGCIVSNPPFHTGLHTDYEIARQFIADAYQALRKGGVLYIVANRFLPWPEVIEKHFGQCQRIAQDTQFAVYYANRK